MITETDLVNAALNVIKDRREVVKGSKIENPTDEQIIVALLVLLGEAHRFIAKNHDKVDWPMGARGWPDNGGDK